MDRCSRCPGDYLCVPPSGPTDARIVAIGEAPGFHENKRGIPFIGPAGQEQKITYWGLAGLDHQDIRIDNIVRCRPDERNSTPKPDLARACADHHIPLELRRTKPEIVILLGAVAVNTLAPWIDLESQHGVPVWGKIYDFWEGWIVPSYHPAAGLHNTGMMTPMLEDWRNLNEWFEHGTWCWPEDEYEGRRVYTLAETTNDVARYFETYTEKSLWWCGLDTESHAGKIFSRQVSLFDGTGLMVLDQHHRLCLELGQWLKEFTAYSGMFFFHNAEADQDEFEAVIGESLTGLFRDTMFEAYEFQNLAQKLKVLSFRLLGRRRQSWEQVVGGYSRQALMDWMLNAAGLAHLTRRFQRVSDKTGKRLKDGHHKSPFLGELYHVMRHVNNNADYDPWKRLAKAYLDTPGLFREECHYAIEQLGELPKLGIANCPLDVARDYGCSDADDTRRIGLLFMTMRDYFHQTINVHESDVDKLDEQLQLEI